ncbi:MAG: peptidoglycan-binding protein [Clostridia bacterium]
MFGTNTYNAVVSFQSAKGLTVDGLVGSGTKNKLWELYGSWLMSNGVMGL